MNACRLANRLWVAANTRRWRRFRRALERPGAAQRYLLGRYLRHNADTAFGRHHGFDRVADAAQFQRRVPLRSYDEYTPWIERVRAGEPRVLTRQPVVRLVPSSGSTAARKLIPYTRSLLRELNRAIGPWIVDLYRRRPELMSGPAYWSISPPPAAAGDDDADSAIPIGFDDDTAYLGGVFRRLVEQTLAVPGEVRRIADHRGFVDATLVHLLSARDLRLISVWHPSFLTLLLAPLAERWSPLVAAAGRRDLAPEDPADPELWRRIWPRLGLISCWGDAGSAAPLAELEGCFPGVRVQPKGLLATEAFVSLPFAGARPAAVLSHFFEFLDDRGRPHLAEELEGGGEYSLAVTTGGGLYRYRLGDRVRVEGFVGATPSLSFVGKEDQVSDLRGEKLNERHVQAVLAEATAGLDAAFALLAPDDGDGGVGYTLYLQSPRPPDPDLARRLEEALESNPHYRTCRTLGQLAPLKVFVVRGGAHHAYLERCGRRQGLGQVKPAALSRRDGWSERFDGAYLAAAEERLAAG